MTAYALGRHSGLPRSPMNYLSSVFKFIDVIGHKGLPCLARRQVGIGDADDLLHTW